MCHLITPTANDVDVLVLQHPLEVHQEKGSARMLRLSLQHCHLIVGEAFDPGALRQALEAGDRRSVLLYPATPDYPAPAVDNADPGLLTGLRLVVLDGTWRKSRKMLHLNPLLQTLPRLALAEPPPSQYSIRKAHRPDQRSTLEATCLALGQLERQPERYAPLQAAFDDFVASVAQRMRPGTAAPSGEAGEPPLDG